MLAIRWSGLDNPGERLRFGCYLGSALERALPFRQRLVAPVARWIHRKAVQNAYD